MRGWKGSEKDEYMGRGVQLYDEKDQYSMRRMNKEWEVWVQDKKMSKAREGSEQIWRISSVWEVIEYSMRRLSTVSILWVQDENDMTTGWKGLVQGWEGSPYRMRSISSYPSWCS